MDYFCRNTINALQPSDYGFCGLSAGEKCRPSVRSLIFNYLHHSKSMMFKRNHIALFCLIVSVFSVSMMIWMVGSKPVTSPSASLSQTSPNKSLGEPSPIITPSLVTGADREFIAEHFFNTLMLLKMKDKDGSEKVVLGYKVSNERASMQLILNLCDALARTSSGSEFYSILNSRYITRSHVMSGDDFQRSKEICSRLLVVEKSKAE